jgi:hypothetical protein
MLLLSPYIGILHLSKQRVVLLLFSLHKWTPWYQAYNLSSLSYLPSACSFSLRLHQILIWLLSMLLLSPYIGILHLSKQRVVLLLFSLHKWTPWYQAYNLPSLSYLPFACSFSHSPSSDPHPSTVVTPPHLAATGVEAKAERATDEVHGHDLSPSPPPATPLLFS